MKNPPAFPRPASEYTKNGTLQEGNDAIREQDGMTLRDYFAAKAMSGWIATYPDDAQPESVDERAVAILAYRIADAMLEARG